MLAIGLVCEYFARKSIGSAVPGSPLAVDDIKVSRNPLAGHFQTETGSEALGMEPKGSLSPSQGHLSEDIIGGQTPVLAVGSEQLIQQKLQGIVGYFVERFTPLAEAGLSATHLAELERELSLSSGALLVHRTVAELAVHLATRHSMDHAASPRSIKHKGAVKALRGVLASTFDVSGNLHIHWRELSVRFTDKIGLYPLSGRIAAQEVVAVMGGSGSGKTTFLKALAGYSLPRGCSVSGTVSSGNHILSCPLIQTPMAAFVPQFGCFLDELTLSETMLFALAVNPSTMSLPALDRAWMATKAFEAVGLAHRVGSRMSTLSGGEIKRAQLCDALLTGAQLLMLDEPTSGLSAREALEFMHLCKAVSEAGVCSVMMSLHQPCQQSFECLTRVLGLCNGKLVFCGAPGTIESHLDSVPFRKGSEGRAVELFSEWLLEAEPHENAVGVHTCPLAVVTVDGALKTRLCVDASAMCILKSLVSLVARVVTVRKRQSATYITTAIVLSQGAFLGCFFYNLPDDASSTLDWLAVCYVVLHFFCQHMLAFAIQAGRPHEVHMHELANAKYGITALVISEFCVDSAQTLIVSAIYASVTAALIGFRSMQPGALSLYIVILWLDSLVFGLVYKCVHCASTRQAAVGIVPAFLFIAGNMSGFERNLRSSMVVRVGSYLSPQYYSLEALLNLEMEGQIYNCDSFAEEMTMACPSLGNGFLQERGFSIGRKWQNATVLIAVVFSLTVMWRIILARQILQ
eukprot:TRINITY_DN2003_c0_g1_i2.p1 TRINITY_DN2003_c0_g1~~TRINITY_DN2003_c0_g1_i2.p1  ORF type:complete len:745 (-),score=40.99 TRINITY_DN2003_c0_g1_i2:173-2407(-)